MKYYIATAIISIVVTWACCFTYYHYVINDLVDIIEKLSKRKS